MKILELFAGTRSIGKSFEEKGHEVFSVDWEKSFDNIDLYIDISKLTVEMIIDKFGIPDIIWASPDCTTYSIAAISYHRNKDRSGKTEYAKFSDKMNNHLWNNIIDKFMKINPNIIYFVENPRGLYRKMPFVKNRNRYTITYCQYGDTRMKPTDIFTNHFNPHFKPKCKNGDSCHVEAPRGSRTGTQGLKNHIERSKIPKGFCDYIVKLSENKKINEIENLFDLFNGGNHE